jgi:hypothetical protein
MRNHQTRCHRREVNRDLETARQYSNHGATVTTHTLGQWIS